MFDPDKVYAIILHVQEVLSKQEKYAFFCELKESEIVELKKHFSITEDGVYDRLTKYIFTKR
jgi:hypothetical protein